MQTIFTLIFPFIIIVSYIISLFIFDVLFHCIIISSLKTKELITVCPHLVRTISAFVGSISELIIQKTEFHSWYEYCMNFILIALEAYSKTSGSLPNIHLKIIPSVKHYVHTV